MLLQHPVDFPADDPDSKTMTILAKDAHVPAKATTYWCAIVKLDDVHVLWLKFIIIILI